MEPKHETEKSKAPQSESSSPRGQGAYYPLDHKKPISSIKRWIAAGLLVMVIAGAGIIASKNMVKDTAEAEISKQLELKKELVQSVLALQDDDYDDKAKNLLDQNKDKVEGGLAAEADLAEVINPASQPEKETPQPVPSVEVEATSAVEDQRAIEEAQRNQIASDTASMQTLTDEAIAREARAEEAIRKHKAEHLKLLQAYQNQPVKVGGPVYQGPVQAQLGLYKGILSKCFIHGHDVHWIDDNGAIIDHVEKDTPLPGSASIARNMIYQMGGTIVVIVYEKGYEVYNSSGELIKVGEYTEHPL